MPDSIAVIATPHSCGTEVSYPEAWEGSFLERFFLLRHVLDCSDTTPEQLTSATELYYTLLPEVEGCATGGG